ncbi:Response regulator receiver sensor signal transduction histidine kinase [Candidatus Magnetomorum sp. HK-1]|nr:Response regulator receiver sensor signal transduction histidine kinase [Candidatus Magnetomorum sp. HK-1]
MSSKRKVLIVDDVSTNLLLIRRILEDHYTVKTAQSGEEALDILPGYRPDIILLDIMMPGMNGYEVCEHIRSQKRYSFIKIILVSAKTMIDDRLKGYEVGADDYVTKPFVKRELLAKTNVFSRLKHEEEINELKTNLLTLFSHETRTPLSAIIGLSDILMRNNTIGDDIKIRIGMIITKAHELLDFAEKTSLLCSLKGDMPLGYTHEKIDSIFSIIFKNLDDQIKEKNISILLENENSISCYADWSLMQKAFTYVLENAIKYSKENGRIEIHASLINDQCRISIEDFGCGIPSDWIETIFDEFAIRDIMHHKKGQGLSLAITRHILELHGGAIRVNPDRKEGAHFVVRFPINHDFDNHNEFNTSKDA